MKNFIIITLLIIASTIAIHSGFVAINLLPVEASAQAVTTDQLFQFYMWGIAFLFSLIIVTMFYALIVFRRRKGETGDGTPIKQNSLLEFSWTAIPLVAVVYLAYMGARSLSENRRIDPSAMVVKVISQQWNWQFQYPDYLIASKDLYLPVGKQVDFQLTSLDVIHGFFIPAFRIKQDALPGRTIDLRVTPTLIGEYYLACSQLCGSHHTEMTAKVYVVSQADFDAWVKKTVASAPKDPVLIGQLLATLNGCAVCHSTDGSIKVGPTWLHLYDSTVTLSNGQKVVANDQYITESIVNPNAKIVAGFSPNVMPDTFANILSQAQITDLIAYIKSLK